MRQRLIMFALLLIAVITNSYALMQTTLTEHSGDIINLLVWAVVTMGASLVTLIIYQFNSLKADVANVKKIVEEFSGRLIAVETENKIRNEE